VRIGLRNCSRSGKGEHEELLGRSKSYVQDRSKALPLKDRGFAVNVLGVEIRVIMATSAGGVILTQMLFSFAFGFGG